MSDIQMIPYQLKYNTTADTPIMFLNFEDFFKRLRNNKPTYEHTGLTNNETNLYFDVDLSDDDVYEEEEKMCIWNEIHDILKERIYEAYKIEPEFHVHEAFGESNEKYKASYHIHVPNIRDYKFSIQKFIEDTNKYVRLNKKTELYNMRIMSKDIIPTFKLLDESVYSNNRYMRCHGTSKPNENRPFKLLVGDLEKTSITYKYPNHTVVNYVKEETQTKTQTNNKYKLSNSQNEKLEVFNMFLENGLFRDIALGKRPNWIKMATALKTEFGDELGSKLFHTFSKIDTERYNEDECDYQFEHVTEGKITFASIMFWAKEENPQIHKKALEMLQTFAITKDQVINPYMCASIISNTLKETLVLCKEQWIMLTENNLWEKRKEPISYITKCLYQYLDYEKNKINALMDSQDGDAKMETKKKLEEWLKLYLETTKPAYTSQLIKYLKERLVDDKFEEKLDVNKGFLAFKNGIMDLKTKTFGEGIRWDDYISSTIPHNYIPSDYSYLKNEVLLKILNNNPEHLEYYLSIIGYIFTGETNQKSLYFMLDKTEGGEGNNGKTFFFDILNDLLPNYVYKSKSTLILDGNTKIHKQLAMTKGKRLVWLEELPKDKLLNAELIKEIADGKTTENEIMYGTSEIINIMFNLVVLSNHMPKINEAEEAVYNRYKQISFRSKFLRDVEEENIEELIFKADENLSETIKTKYVNQVMNIIIDYAHKFYNSGVNKIPKEFTKDIQETKNNNNKFAKWFTQNCQISDIGKTALKELIKLSGVEEEKIKLTLKKMGFIYNKDLRGCGKDAFGKYYKGGFEGFEIIKDTDEEEEE